MNQPEQWTGEHITARMGRGGVIQLRNNDNICGATVATGRRAWGAAKDWAAFLAAARKEMPFAEGVAFFEERGVRMSVTG